MSISANSIRFESLLLKERGIAVGVMYPGKDAPAGVPLIRAGDIKNGLIDQHVNFRISAEVHEEYKRTALEGGELLITLVGNPGVVAIVPDTMIGWNAARAIAVVRLQDPREARYIRATFSAPDIQRTIDSVCNTTVQKTLNLKDIRALEIPWPEKSTRLEIAAILGALDNKIEVNRKASATLEAMARALYRSWFVDFDPVWAKLENRPPAHMPPQTAALFPDSFDDEGLPEGWGLVPYLDFVEIISGGTPKTTEPSYWNGDIPWYSVVDAPPSGQVFVHGTEKTISAAGFQASAVKLVPRGTTIISARGTVGKLAIAGQDMVFNQSCYGLQGRTERLDAFVYFATERAIEQLQSMAHGSVFATITRKTFEGLDMPRATPPVLRAFEGVCAELLGRIHSFGLENQTLATLRDSLLPRLMSGELRVGDARAQVEEVV